MKKAYFWIFIFFDEFTGLYTDLRPRMIENLEGEIIKIKDFVAREKMVAKGMNETRQKLKILNNEIKAKFGKTSSEKKIIKEIESLTEKVLKIKNNFKKSVGSELEKCAEICREEIVNLEKKVLLTK